MDTGISLFQHDIVFSSSFALFFIVFTINQSGEKMREKNIARFIILLWFSGINFFIKSIFFLDCFIVYNWSDSLVFHFYLVDVKCCTVRVYL